MSAAVKSTKRILGMNARNLEFIRPFNKRKAVQLARNKLATKERLLEHGLPTAPLYAQIRNRKELFEFDWSSLPSSFVLKPNFGLGGNGILIIYGKTKSGRWIGAEGETYDEEDLKIRVSNILDGNYSISNIPDIAYFEQRLLLSEYFKPISYKGIPDIRVIVFNSVPVMAELRLPTKSSSGKANLALGGVGVGIDLVSGETTYATIKHVGEVQRHPDYNTQISGIKIPHWDEILRISIQAQQAVGLGYAGVDIVLDREVGPSILEVNGHPGLEIQNANNATLRDRLERVRGLTITSAIKGVKVCKELFGPETNLDTNKPILGVFETIDIERPNGKLFNLRVRIDTGLTSTTLTKELANKIGYTEAMAALDNVVFPSVVSSDRAKKVEEEFRQSIKGIHSDITDIVAVRTGDKYVIRPKIKLSFILGGEKITADVAIAMDNKLSHPMMVGRRDLNKFLINPAKTK